MSEIEPLVLVHGGAGVVDDSRHDAVLAGVTRAAAAGREVLVAGGSALDAAQRAVEVLEDDPEFNAGVGSALTRERTVECDASIVDGLNSRCGAVAAVPNARSAITLARAVLDAGEHVLLAGQAAWAFAAEIDLAARCGERGKPSSNLITERALARWQVEADRRGGAVRHEPDGGTVGAVARDAAGRVAAATSTGGMTWKRSGRVGDSPIPGAGTWADERGGAASATGDGEAILRVTFTRQVIDRIRAGATPADAAAATIRELHARTGGSVGVICLDPNGRFTAMSNTATMPWAFARLTGKVAASMHAPLL